MNYKIPNHILDIIMPICRQDPELSPAKAIEQAIIQYYQHEDNVCQQIQQSRKK